MSGEGARTEDAGSVYVWQRWTGERDIPFHRYCRLYWERRPPLPVVGGPPPEGREPPLQYAPPIVRWALRHTPLLVLVATVIYAVEHFGPMAIVGFNSFVLAVATPTSGPVVPGLLLWLVVLLLLVRAAIITPDRNEVLQGLVVNGLAVTLTGGLVVGFYAAAPGTQLPVSPDVEAAFVRFPWNFLWMLFFGGHLVYDGMLRTENLFTRLHTKQPAVIDSPSAYTTDFVAQLQEKLDHSVPRDVRLPRLVRDRFPQFATASFPTAYLFAIVFVAPFYLLWTLVPVGSASEPVTVRAVTALVPAVLDFFLVVVFFQFLVLIAFFNHLLTYHGVEPAEGAAFALQYRPDHPDRYAGFRDLGRFATRVNVILVIGGIYEAYQLSVYGFPTYPGLAEGLTAELFSWAVGNLLPLVTYVLAVLLWMYLSFWQLHKTMRRGRELQQERYVHEFDSVERTLDEAPVWPVNNRLLVSIVSMDLLPMLTLLPFIPS